MVSEDKYFCSKRRLLEKLGVEKVGEARDRESRYELTMR